MIFCFLLSNFSQCSSRVLPLSIIPTFHTSDTSCPFFPLNALQNKLFPVNFKHRKCGCVNKVSEQATAATVANHPEFRRPWWNIPAVKSDQF